MNHPISVNNRHSGFTLIELSIVLVVIGLIVGGVLVGQDLIQAAKVRSVISTIEQTNTAANTFKLKYGHLPGDCPNATTFFPDATQPTKTRNGNANKLLIGADSTGTIGSFSNEQALFYDHLALANLINLAPFDDESGIDRQTVGTGYPSLPIGTGLAIGVSGQTGVDLPINHHHFLIGCIYNDDDGWCETVTPTLPASAAYQIDSKLDDGAPLTGTVVASQSTVGDDPIFSLLAVPAVSGACVTTAAGNPYSANNDMCSILVKTNF